MQEVAQAGEVNGIRFGAGIVLGSLRGARNARGVTVLRYGPGAGAIKLPVAQIAHIELADGTRLTGAPVRALFPPITGSAGNDYLFGDAGAETVMGEAGDDFLDGAAGDDRLIGGDGDDRYRFGPGSGNDTLVEMDDATSGRNSIELAAGIVPARFVWTRFCNSGRLSQGKGLTGFEG